MRWPFVRITMRQRVVAAAVVVGLGLGGYRWDNRMRALSEAYRQKAAAHGGAAYRAQRDLMTRLGLDTSRRGSADDREWRARATGEELARVVEHGLSRVYFHARMMQTYQHAALHPWEAIDPDPAPP